MNKGLKRYPAPLGSIEPHAALLTAPAPDRLLYKMMTIENLLRSIDGNYLHFNRVDRYADFPGADVHDGQQLPADRPGNAHARFLKAPDYSAADYYDQARARTYACCFSLENSDHIWKEYANGSPKGKVCVVFDFGRLRSMLNASLDPATARLLYNGVACRQIFSVNYGVVDYVDWDQHQANEAHLPNPISYSFLKAKRFSDEKELRISLSAFGVGRFALNDGSELDFPESFPMSFDFRAALTGAAIRQILCAPDCDARFLHLELDRRGIAPAPGSDRAM